MHKIAKVIANVYDGDDFEGEIDFGNPILSKRED